MWFYGNITVSLLQQVENDDFTINNYILGYFTIELLGSDWGRSTTFSSLENIVGSVMAISTSDKATFV